MRVRLYFLLPLFFVLITLPYIYAAFAAGPDYMFGGFLINPLDGNSYLAKMYQGWRGDWRYTLPYSSDPGQGAYLFLFYILLGHIARWFGLSRILVFHLARLVCAGMMAFALLQFFKTFRKGDHNRELIFSVLLLGSGLGWLVFPFGLVLSDLWVAETYPFLSAYANPHFPLGLSLILWLLLITYKDMQNDDTVRPEVRTSVFKMAISTLFLSLILSIVAPFGVVIVLVVLAGMLVIALIQPYAAIRSSGEAGLSSIHPPLVKKWITPSIQMLIWQILCVFLGGGLVLLYEIGVATMDPVLVGWDAQNLTPSPPMWDLVLSLAPAFLLAILGGWRLLRYNGSGEWVLLIWVGLGMVLLYMPIGLQRRFMMGLFVPVVGLAAMGLEWIASHFGADLERRTGRFLLLLSLPTNLILLVLAFYGIRTHEPLYYLTSGEQRAFEWIEEHTDTHALILAAPDTGMYIPAHTGRRVIYGHPFETVDAQSEEATVKQFFQGKGELSTEEVLERRGVDYIFYGPRERALGSVPTGELLQQVYSEEDVIIYRVVNSARSSTP